LLQKEANLKFQYLEKYKKDTIEKLFELYAPFPNTLKENDGPKIIQLHPKVDLLKNSYERFANSTLGGSGLGGSSLDTNNVFYQQMLREIEDQKQSLPFRALAYITYFQIILALLPPHFNESRNTNMAGPLATTIFQGPFLAAALLYLSISYVNMPILSKVSLGTLITFQAIGIVEMLIHVLTCSIVTWYEWLLAVLAILASVAAIFFLFRLMENSILGSVGGPEQHFSKFVGKMENKAKEFNYEAGGNKELPDIGDIDNFRV
jgi:hypothetical protein